MKNLRIVFMGTPGFAAGILETIIHQGYHVVAVVTAPDKPAGRGQKVKFSAVKEYALEKGLPVLQPVKLRDPEFLQELAGFNANVQVVVAFRMLPDVVFKMPELGTFNLHASLLPDYRGAAPINWSIANGDTKTGVTTFFIDEKIDTGEIILQREIAISPDDDAGTLHDKLMQIGGETVVETLKLIVEGDVVTVKQADSPELRPAPKLDKDNTKINWNNSCSAIENLIRGMSPYPAAWTWIASGGDNLNVKIYKASKIVTPHKHQPGTILRHEKSWQITCADGYIEPLVLQFPGKKKMEIGELINGFRLSEDAKAQ